MTEGLQESAPRSIYGTGQGSGGGTGSPGIHRGLIAHGRREPGRTPGTKTSPSYRVDRSEEHTSELHSQMRSSYTVVRLKKTTRPDSSLRSEKQPADRQT